MKIPKAKLKAMIKYFCSNTNPVYLGKTKLMKLFYFADFMHVKKYGIPITFDKYKNYEHGPVPSDILHAVNSVVDDPEHAILSDTMSVKIEDSRNIQQIICTKPFTKEDEEYFSERELETLRNVCRIFGEKNTKFTEDVSHKESAWMETREWADIPYTLAAHDDDSNTTEEEIKLLLNSR